MFGIALGSVCKDLEGSLLELPAERSEAAAAVDEEPGQPALLDDELSRRRRARDAG